MDEPKDIAERTQRFNEAARTFTQPCPSRHAKLAPFLDGIVELRQRGASLRFIRELLATVGVSVGTDTIARFLAEVNGESSPTPTSKRSARRRASVPNPARLQPLPKPIPSAPQYQSPPQPSPPDNDPQPDTSTDRSRTRGPRIADPRNL